VKPQLNTAQINAARQIMAGNSNQSVTSIHHQSANYKHNINFDFGYPETSELSFTLFYDMWRRNGFAHGLTEKTASKTWQEFPEMWESETRKAKGKAKGETKVEKDIRQHFASIRFWQQLKETDMRSMVGKYAAVILQLGDGLKYDQPVERVRGGITGLVGVLPAWEGQLEPSGWDTDDQSPNYGKPKMYNFNESAVDPENGKVRTFMVHPDRVLIWSRDGTTFGDSKLEACYNALIDMEKIRGAGGEGFWKNAKSMPVLEALPDVDFPSLATMLGVEIDGIADALDEVMGKWVKGADNSLMLQGMTAKTLGVSLPIPKEFFSVAAQEVSASWPIPQKELIGMQTGERASTEDAASWSQTNMGRRDSLVIPNIMALMERFEKWGMIPERDWFVSWSDLTAPTLEEKLLIGERMAKINQAMFATGDIVFTEDEIREVAGYEANGDDDLSEPLGLDIDGDDVDGEGSTGE
jgi:hypothetical protein